MFLSRGQNREMNGEKTGALIGIWYCDSIRLNRQIARAYDASLISCRLATFRRAFRQLVAIRALRMALPAILRNHRGEKRNGLKFLPWEYRWP